MVSSSNHGAGAGEPCVNAMPLQNACFFPHELLSINVIVFYAECLHIAAMAFTHVVRQAHHDTACAFVK